MLERNRSRRIILGSVGLVIVVVTIALVGTAIVSAKPSAGLPKTVDVPVLDIRTPIGEPWY